MELSEAELGDPWSNRFLCVLPQTLQMSHHEEAEGKEKLTKKVI